MRFTGLANAAIDRIMPDPASFAAGIHVYGERDLLCYRADAPAALVARQAAALDPLLDWAAQRYDVHFTIVSGIMHAPQPEVTLDRLLFAVRSPSPFLMAGFSPPLTFKGSA